MSAENGELTSEEKGKLSDAWQRYGCALCGQTVAYRAEHGRLELHRLIPGARGGKYETDNIAGLCDAFLPNRCHERVTRNEIKIAFESDVGAWVWTDTETGETDLLRTLRAPTRSRRSVLTVNYPARNSSRTNLRAAIPEEHLPSTLHAEQGVLGAQERFRTAQELVVRAERTWMALALIVQAAMQMDDDVTLGFESKMLWGEAVGLSSGMVSKLRLVASQFQGAWLELPRQDRDNLSFEGLYCAAKMMKWGVWDREQALAEAVAKPASQLWLDLRGLTAPVERCECPKCGASHWTKERGNNVLRRERDESEATL